jgi:hypothetical protein
VPCPMLARFLIRTLPRGGGGDGLRGEASIQSVCSKPVLLPGSVASGSRRWGISAGLCPLQVCRLLNLAYCGQEVSMEPWEGLDTIWTQWLELQQLFWSLGD